ncbi:DUF2235 domain-containing protein [Mycolicibacterium helvum]
MRLVDAQNEERHIQMWFVGAHSDVGGGARAKPPGFFQRMRGGGAYVA